MRPKRVAEVGSEFQILVNIKWPGGPRCTYCESKDNSFNERRLIYQCNECRKQFSVTTGTVLHGTRMTPAQLVVVSALVIKEGKPKFYKGAHTDRALEIDLREIMTLLETKSMSSAHRIYRIMADTLYSLPDGVNWKEFMATLLRTIKSS